MMPARRFAVSIVGLVAAGGLSWQMAAAQAEINALIPRPPMPIPNVVALMPPTAPLLRSAPTPIPPPTMTVVPVPPPRPMPVLLSVPSRIALPPVEFDHAYEGKLTVLKEDNYALIRHVCKETLNPVACSYRTYDSISGETLSCLILLGPAAHDDPKVMRHEMGHCRGWSNAHEGARYDD
jgi:hypothetical protein